jgi:hypothetical protein
MSEESIRTAGILLITVPAIAFGGAMLLRLIWGRAPGYLDNPVRQNLWRAGHAHAGVLAILALLGCCTWIKRGFRVACRGSSVCCSSSH